MVLILKVCMTIISLCKSSDFHIKKKNKNQLLKQYIGCQKCLVELLSPHVYEPIKSCNITVSIPHKIHVIGERDYQPWIGFTELFSLIST